MPTTPEQAAAAIESAVQSVQESVRTDGVNDLGAIRAMRSAADSLTAGAYALETASKAHEREVATIVTDLLAVAGDVRALDGGVQVWTPRFPGDVQPGTIRWGCSQRNNGVPTAHETAAGVPVGVRRTFWRLDQAAKIVDTARADIAAGRVPWVSIKLGTSWTSAAGGSIDAQLRDLFQKLGALGGAVWFTAHHEPEGGNGTPYPDEGQGSEPQWRAMQQQVRRVLDASGATNIAFASILMAWTFSPSSGRNPADWWVDGVWDLAGIDNYVEAAATTVRTAGWDNAVAFYAAKGLPVALGEWGNKDHTASGAAEMTAWYEHLLDVGVVAASYFDTDANGGVPLSGAVLTRFRELMADPRSVTL